MVFFFFFFLSCHQFVSSKFSSDFNLLGLLIIVVTLDGVMLFVCILNPMPQTWALQAPWSLITFLRPPKITDAGYWLPAVTDILVGYEFVSSFQFTASNITTLNFSDSRNTWPSDYFFQCVMIISISQTSIRFYFCISFKMQYNSKPSYLTAPHMFNVSVNYSRK